MPHLLFELLTEEIPAFVQAEAAGRLRDDVLKRLAEAGLAVSADQARLAVTPRRMILFIDSLPATQPDREEVRKGPRVGSPDGAIQGFLRAAGLANLDEAEQRDGVWFAIRKVKGAPTHEVLPRLLCAAMVDLPWPKSMRWRDARLPWSRPIHNLLGLFGDTVLPGGLHLGRMARGEDAGREPGYADGPDRAEDPNFLPFTRRSQGHRFLARDWFEIETGGFRPTAQGHVTLLAAELRRRFVEVDEDRRVEAIRTEAEALAARVGCRLVPDQRLIREIAGLVEWPVPVLGRIDKASMALPPEVLILTMRNHQRYLALAHDDGRLAPYFVAVANIPLEDQTRAVVAAGFERVLRARLADARYFWEKDRATPLESLLKPLETRTFHAKLGTVRERVERIRTVAGDLAAALGADPALVDRAALLAKADLSSGMVGEFPELQGIMGGHVAAAQGEPGAIVEAIRAQYWPAPGAPKPEERVAIIINLADKLDQLGSFFSIDEVPSGSRDPFGLRRAALGVVRLILDHSLLLDLKALLAPSNASPILEFLFDRLRVFWREEGIRHDLIEAVLRAAGDTGDLVSLRDRLDALTSFLGTESGQNLLAGHKRATNILRIEEKRTGSVEGETDPVRFEQAEERDLYGVLQSVRESAQRELEHRRYVEAMAHLAELRGPVDAFFAAVTVNAEDAALRQNRLRLLALLRHTFRLFADFSVIEGAA